MEDTLAYVLKAEGSGERATAAANDRSTSKRATDSVALKMISMFLRRSLSSVTMMAEVIMYIFSRFSCNNKTKEKSTHEKRICIACTVTKVEAHKNIHTFARSFNEHIASVLQTMEVFCFSAWITSMGSSCSEKIEKDQGTQ
jgi:hypothetical protein